MLAHINRLALRAGWADAGLAACFGRQQSQGILRHRGLHAPAALRRQASADGALIGLAAQRAEAGVDGLGRGGHERSVEAWRFRLNRNKKCTLCMGMECIFNSYLSAPFNDFNAKCIETH